MNVLCYRLNRTAKPSAVLEALRMLLKEYSVFHTQCLLNVKNDIIEYEHEGKLHSNRNRNAIKTLLKKYPELKPFYRYAREEKENHTEEHISISNFSSEDFVSIGEIPQELVFDLVKQVPRPYAVNDLDFILDCISFGGSKPTRRIHLENGSDIPAGNYIWYNRTHYGDERHSYILFSADDENLESMRKLFFAFAERIPGKYDGIK